MEVAHLQYYLGVGVRVTARLHAVFGPEELRPPSSSWEVMKARSLVHVETPGWWWSSMGKSYDQTKGYAKFTTR
jgi:hypothetical protein